MIATYGQTFIEYLGAGAPWRPTSVRGIDRRTQRADSAVSGLARQRTPDRHTRPPHRGHRRSRCTSAQAAETVGGSAKGDLRCAESALGETESRSRIRRAQGRPEALTAAAGSDELPLAHHDAAAPFFSPVTPRAAAFAPRRSAKDFARRDARADHTSRYRKHPTR
jgi:hypothetical protein